MATCPPLPITEVARDEVLVGAETKERPERWRRLDAYARGLLNAIQEEVGDAEPILDEVMRLAPERAHGAIDLARLRIRQGRTADADALLDSPRSSTRRPRWSRSCAGSRATRSTSSPTPSSRCASLSAARPTSSTRVELLAEALAALGRRPRRARRDAAGLLFDPESAQLQHLQALAFDRLGLTGDAEIARALPI